MCLNMYMEMCFDAWLEMNMCTREAKGFALWSRDSVKAGVVHGNVKMSIDHLYMFIDIYVHVHVFIRRQPFAIPELHDGYCGS